MLQRSRSRRIAVASRRRLGRFSKDVVPDLNDPSLSDPYNLMRFVRGYQRHYSSVCAMLARGERKDFGISIVFPCPVLVMPGGAAVLSSPNSVKIALHDLDDPTNGGHAAAAFLRFPTTDGVNLRLQYLRAVKLVLEHVTNRAEPPIGLVGVTEGSKLRHSLTTFCAAAAVVGFDELRDVCAAILPTFAAKWPLPSPVSWTGIAARPLHSRPGARELELTDNVARRDVGSPPGFF